MSEPKSCGTLTARSGGIPWTQVFYIRVAARSHVRGVLISLIGRVPLKQAHRNLARARHSVLVVPDTGV